MGGELNRESKVLKRRLSIEQKLAIVRASYESAQDVSEVARKHNVGVSSLVKWRKLASEGSLMGIYIAPH